jgi:hypothetical protein
VRLREVAAVAADGAIAAIHGEAERPAALHDRIEGAWRPGIGWSISATIRSRQLVRRTVDEVPRLPGGAAQPGGFGSM